MKKINVLRGIMLVTMSIVLLATVGCSAPKIYKRSAAASTTSVNPKNNGDFVKDNGWLKVSKGQLCNEKGNAIQLRGMSTNGIASYPEFVNKDSIKYLRDTWNTNVIRIAMCTDGDNGYIKDSATNKKRVIQAVKDAISNGIYVIVDWHILTDNDPNTYKKESKEFFKEISSEFKNSPNVIYEICNEPSGKDIKWSSKIKPYADEIIPVIRANSAKSIVIVGTGTWSQDVTDAAESPLSYENIMYTCHFYAGTQKQELRDKISTALSKKIAIFVTEWGTSEDTGDGGPFTEETKTWLDFLDKNKLSWCNWSLCDRKEASAALKPGANPTGGWADSDISESGRIVKEALTKGLQSTKKADKKSSSSTSKDSASKDSGSKDSASKDSASKDSGSKDSTSKNSGKADAKGLNVEMFNGTQQASNNSITPKFKLTNGGSGSIDLSEVKIRYYYTADGATAQNFFCDWSTAGNSNVAGSFVKMQKSKTKADYYLEISFKSGAGKLDAGKSVEVQTRFAKSDWSNYDQSNDFSFDSTDSNYAKWDKVAVYVSGKLAAGTEP